ncbi:MAG: ABC transporter permease, partial [Longimicrobiales bacterium]
MREPAHPEGPPRPSWIVRVALRWLLPDRERGAVLSELRELWERRVGREGEARARQWYGRQLRGYPFRLLRDRSRQLIRGTVRDQGGSANGSDHGAGVHAGIGGDVKHALRGWSRSPVLALTIVLTVGLGLGASTAMFAVVRAVLLDPLPYAGADRLVRIYHAIGGNRWNLSVVDFEAIESQQTRFDAVAAYSSSERTLTSGGEVERVGVRAVTAGWFDLLGIRAAQGRTFEAADGELAAPSTAVVSWGFWQRYLGSATSALGRPIRLDGQD